MIEEVSARATKNLTHGAYEYKESSSIGGLKKIISKAGRGISIRDVLIRYDDLIRQYFPCFLMSPLSAAQYLSVDNEIGTKRFDIVIFDEASQIPVHEAVGPIARGNSLIVAGDPQQMPPTTYFTSDISLPSDEVDNQDASSLLDECLAIEFPSIRLSYHYRSKHESLIDFSNKNFYEGDLHTFPSSSKGKKALSFEKVALSEKKIDSRLSEEETKAILKRLALIYGSEENKDKSVGIIVFNIKQKESLEKALESYLDKDKELARKIAEAEASSGDKLFIKSIENVQGDERDIILLCIGFRKSASGRAVIVGPLALSGGERRLNVAITRSKQRMYIISTIDDSDFDEDIYIANRGVLTLKHFLTYAKGEEVKASREEEFLTRKRLDIASFLCKDLERKGYLCDRDVGESKNKVDIAIRGEDKNTYALGILIDNDEEVSSSSLRDKEYVEPLVYNALNWKIIKVYAVSYYKNKAETLNRIILSMNKPYIRIETRLQPTIEKKEIDASYKATEYKSVDLETLPDLLYRPSFGFSPNIKAALLSIIEEEGPIAESLIKARVKQKIGMSALSPTAQLYLSNELRYFAPCLDADGFYWPPSKSEHTMEEFRFGGERDIAEIPYCEFASAFSQIEAIQGSLSDEDLFKATLEAFDYGAHKLTKKNKDVLEKMHARYVKK